MSEALQVGVLDDDGEPPSSGLDEATQQLLYWSNQGYYYSETLLGLGDARVRISDGLSHVAVRGLLFRHYTNGDHAYKQELADTVERNMDTVARQTKQAMGGSVALMNHAPLLFEPTAHKMVLGDRDDDRGVIELQFDEPLTRGQRQVLLGGVAAFIWFLEQRESDTVQW